MFSTPIPYDACECVCVRLSLSPGVSPSKELVNDNVLRARPH